MAKRKKHHKHSKHTKKSRKQNSSVVKNTTNDNKPTTTISTIEPKEPKKIENTPVATAQNKLVLSDVRLSLVLLGLIMMAFFAIALLMSNQSVANSVYGLFKINN